MMNNKLSKLKRIAIFLVQISAASIPAMASADWTITGLGTLGGTDSYGFDINNSGQVVGNSDLADGSTHAFITGPNGMGMTDLGTFGGTQSWAAGINNSGQVVGSADTIENFEHAFITGPNGMGMTDLGTLGGNYSHASGINNSGQVVGYSAIADSFNQHAFITGPNGVGMRAVFGAVSSDNPSSFASGINDSGQVIGVFPPFEGNWYSSPFLTGPNGVGNIPFLPSAEFTVSDINNAGQVIGYSHKIDEHGDPDLGPVHAFITGPNGVGMTDLGTLGGNYTYAYGINDSGQVVGNAYTTEGFLHAFIYSHGTMTDLSLLTTVFEGGWTHLSLVDINDNGQIVGFGTLNGHTQAFLLSPTAAIPEPETYAMLLAGLGLLGFMARRKKESAV